MAAALDRPNTARQMVPTLAMAAAAGLAAANIYYNQPMLGERCTGSGGTRA